MIKVRVMYPNTPPWSSREEILADIPNYADLDPVLQISEVIVG